MSPRHADVPDPQLGLRGARTVDQVDPSRARRRRGDLGCRLEAAGRAGSVARQTGQGASRQSLDRPRLAVADRHQPQGSRHDPVAVEALDVAAADRFDALASAEHRLTVAAASVEGAREVERGQHRGHHPSPADLGQGALAQALELVVGQGGLTHDLTDQGETGLGVRRHQAG